MVKITLHLLFTPDTYTLEHSRRRMLVLTLSCCQQRRSVWHWRLETLVGSSDHDNPDSYTLWSETIWTTMLSTSWQCWSITTVISEINDVFYERSSWRWIWKMKYVNMLISSIYNCVLKALTRKKMNKEKFQKNLFIICILYIYKYVTEYVIDP